MSQVYPRNVGSRSAGVHARPTGSKGHAASWSRSSNEDLVSSLHLTPREDELIQAGPPDDAVEPPYSNVRDPWWRFVPRRFRPISLRRAVLLLLTIVLLGAGWMFSAKDLRMPNRRKPALIDGYTPPMPHPPAGYTITAEASRPVEWLRKNTILDLRELSKQQVQTLIDTRPKAALISLVRNEEVEAMVASIAQVEARFNKRETHQYDWVFFNNEEFTEEFKEAVTKATSSKCYFERIEEENWGPPEWIDKDRFDVGRQFLSGIGVGKAWLESYHDMCRWNAGLFAMEKRLADYDWYWRVEPGVQFHCDIRYDVFRFMQENNMVYGFNMAILDDARSFPSLWEHTKKFISRNWRLIHPEADFNWVLYDSNDRETRRPDIGVNYVSSDGEYNNCQFYSNFEIGSLKFFRGEEHQAFFKYLDRTGGFYYERYGDAPVHTLSVSMFLPKTQIWFFRDIGYTHGLCEQCPPHEHQLAPVPGPNGQLPRGVELQVNGTGVNTTVVETTLTGPFESFGSKRRQWDEVARDVKRQMGIPGLSCGCTTSAIDNNNAKLVPFESKQRKPSDPCILIQEILQIVMMLSTFWMVEKLIPSSRGTSYYDTFVRAMLFTSVTLYVLWGLPWAVSKLISHHMDNSHKLHHVTQLFFEQAN